MWMLLVLFYGLCKGGREIVKKKAMETSTVIEVLLFYTFVSFLMVVPQVSRAGGLELKYYFYIALKSFFIFIAWICSFKALKSMPISLYGVLDLSRVLFATLLGILVLGERPGFFQSAGLALVCLGLLSLKVRIRFIERFFEKKDPDCSPVHDDKKNTDTKPVTPLVVMAAFTSCMLNALSGLMDKILMKDLTSSQLQFWYMLFLLSYYIIYVLIARRKIRMSTLKNKWVWLLALLFVLADKALFVANGMEGSRLTVMTLIKQSGCIVTILGGKIVFKEKNVGYKLFCATVIIAGIVAGVIGA